MVCFSSTQHASCSQQQTRSLRCVPGAHTLLVQGTSPKGKHSSSMGFTDLLQVLPSDWGHHVVQCSQLARLQVTVGHTARLLHPSSLHLSTLGLSQPAPPWQCIPLPRPHHRGRVGTDPGKRLPSHILSKLGPRGSSHSQMPELQAS